DEAAAMGYSLEWKSQREAIRNVPRGDHVERGAKPGDVADQAWNGAPVKFDDARVQRAITSSRSLLVQLGLQFHDDVAEQALRERVSDLLLQDPVARDQLFTLLPGLTASHGDTPHALTPTVGRIKAWDCEAIGSGRWCLSGQSVVQSGSRKTGESACLSRNQNKSSCYAV